VVVVGTVVGGGVVVVVGTVVGGGVVGLGGWVVGGGTTEFVVVAPRTLVAMMIGLVVVTGSVVVVGATVVVVRAGLGLHRKYGLPRFGTWW
jgi:hypothetical protein